MANTTCPSDMIPAIESLAIPQDINVMVIPGTDTSNPPMVTCCAPNRVQIIDRCWLWCELPQSYLNGSTQEDARGATSTCLRINGRNSNESKITGWQFNTAGRTERSSAKQIGLWVLALSGLIYVL
ncbi:hypothetical protein C8A00DRAFT_44226 [Chaetomidium leptoderma]|uniref:Uncharacterized protein n=1 Tax=Chaetomidium leptoderma TaxID=669021 RepID=A0AAN6VK18_9PEZI|nr:hypothetical protein C8A00DRAFT_44226 [Chaetomidium leptoderma]